MRHADFLGLLDTWHRAKKNLSSGKSGDYADNEDTLANFKRMQQLCEILDIRPGERVEDVLLFLLLLKLDRICNLLHAEKVPAHESMDDSLQDNSLYLDLLRALAVEKDEEDDERERLLEKVGLRFPSIQRSIVSDR